MTAPVRIESYPAWMLELAAAFQRGEHSHRYEFRTLSEARRMQRQLYGLQAAIIREGGETRREYSAFLAARVERHDTHLHVVHVDILYPQPKEIK